jgi:hypothetical protein
LRDVTFGGGIFLAVGGRIQSSVDGQGCVEETAELTDLLNAVAYGDGLFVAVGESGQALTSANGASWTRATTGTAARLNGVAHGEGWFIAVGDAGTILASTNGQPWERRTSGTQKSLTETGVGRLRETATRGSRLTAFACIAMLGLTEGECCDARAVRDGVAPSAATRGELAASASIQSLGASR